MITFTESLFSSLGCVTYLIATVHTRALNQPNAFKSQARFCCILAAISLHQGPEGAVAGGEGKGRSGACVPTQAIHVSNFLAI